MLEWITAISGAAVAVGLIFNAVNARELIRQTKLLTVSNRAVLVQGLTQDMQTLTRILIKQPHLRRYIYDGFAVPDNDPIRSQVLALAEMYVDMMWNMVQSTAFLSEDERNGWHRYFVDLTSSSKAIQDFWQANRHWYDPALWALLDQPVQTAVRNREVSKISGITVPQTQAQAVLDVLVRAIGLRLGRTGMPPMNETGLY